MTWFIRRSRRLLALLALGPGLTIAESYRLYVGTYTGGESQGIYVCEFRSETGELTEARLAAATQNPSFLALSPDRRYLYAVRETGKFQDQDSGGVSAWRLGDDGSLTLINELATGGGAPCHLAIDRSGKHLLVANYSGGNVAVFRLGEDGRLERRTELVQHLGSGPDLRRQTAPHAHSINLDRRDRFAVAADLGIDRLFVYPLQPDTGRLDLARARAVPLQPGSGPRHLAFHPSRDLAFVNGELDSTLTSLSYDPERGYLSILDVRSTLPPDYRERSHTAEVLVHPSGKFVYVSNRGHDSIAVFGLNEGNGKLTPVEQEPVQGRTPRNFNVTPDGKHLFAANQHSGTVVVFRIDADTGALEPTGTSLRIPTPVCLKFMNWQDR